MGERSDRLFSSEGFLPHGHCYLWDPGVLWTHVVSDLLIGLAYTTIPLALWFLLHRRRDVPFNGIIALFGLFIVSCGATHFMEVYTAWHPAYRLAGAVKVVTAAASVLTACQLVRFLPAAVALPNITEYQGMYELAKEAQESYRALLEASLDGFYVLEPVRDEAGALVDFRLTDLNSAAEGQLGLPRDALVGRRLGEIDGDTLLGPLLPSLAAVVTARRPLQREHATADRHFVLQAAPLKDGIGVTLRDVTEQKRAAERLRESEERYRLIVSQAPVTFFAMDRHATYTLADGKAYARMGVDPASLRGRNALEAFAHVPDAVALIRRGLAGEEAAGLVEVGDIVLNSRITPLRGASGAVVGVTGIGLDVTDQVRAERELKALTETLERRVRERTAELEAANEELRSFSYTVAHDLRSPLRAMDGFTDAILLDEGTRLSEQATTWLERVRRSATRMSHLIDDLLKLTRVARVDLVREEVDLSVLAEEIVAELRNGSPDREVRVDITPGLRAGGDPYLLRVALHNLFANAWKFTSRTPEPHVVFEAVTLEGRRVFVVRDNGIGFEMQYVDQLFTAFQRLHTDAQFEGNGIGLATVKRIVGRHGGEVWAEGEPDRGAAVYFTLDDAAGPATRG